MTSAFNWGKDGSFMASMHQTPSGERIHIAFFGRRNAGKSSLVNAFTGQTLSIVSPVEGTTTDPVSKAMELAPVGPVQIIDTAGLDDVGTLGQLRIDRSYQILNKTDLAILVTDATRPWDSTEDALLKRIQEKGIPYLVVRNKADLLSQIPNDDGFYVSAKTGFHIHELKELAAELVKQAATPLPLVGDLLSPGDLVVLVIPIDKAAPKGRLILPQQQVIRDILDMGACALVCRDTELTATLQKLSAPPKLVITDSQVFGTVNNLLPDHVPLTSFSILMARHKGILPQAVAGANAVFALQDGDKVLISEGCTHHRQCGDIGTQKIPNLIRKVTGTQPDFSFTSGGSFPEDVSGYKLVIHCGGCMLSQREMAFRMGCCGDQNVPVTNYGVLIAHLNGILRRSVEPIPEIPPFGD